MTNPFKQENLYYNKGRKIIIICPMGQQPGQVFGIIKRKVDILHRLGLDVGIPLYVFQLKITRTCKRLKEYKQKALLFDSM